MTKFYEQEHICTSASQMECVEKIEVKRFDCMKKCEGLQVTSYDSFKPDPQIQRISDELLREYNVFKGIANNLGKFINLLLNIFHNFQKMMSKQR